MDLDTTQSANLDDVAHFNLEVQRYYFLVFYGTEMKRSLFKAFLFTNISSYICNCGGWETIDFIHQITANTRTMSNVVISECPICGSNKIEKRFDCEDYFSSSEIFPISDCLQCGFRLTNHFPPEERIGNYYDTANYISHSDSDKGVTNKLYQLFRRIMLRRKVRLVKRFTNHIEPELLDIGCGTGHFLQTARAAGFRVTGIEKSSMAREKAHSLFNLDVLEDLDHFIPEHSFEVITLWHVLEHLEKLNESIAKISSILAQEGTLVVALPNHHSYDAEVYGKQWAAYDVPRHLWHFTSETVEQLMLKHGMRVVKRYRMPLDAFYISLVSESYKGSSPWSRFPKAFLVGMTGYLLSLFDLKQSSSIIYIIKK